MSDSIDFREICVPPSLNRIGDVMSEEDVKAGRPYRGTRPPGKATPFDPEKFYSQIPDEPERKVSWFKKLLQKIRSQRS